MLLRRLRLLLDTLSDRRLLLPELLLRRPVRRLVLFPVGVFLVRLETRARVVPVAVPERHVRPGIRLLSVHRPVQEVVDEVILRRLFADVLAAGRHADQVHLVEDETFWTYPRVSGAVLTVMEHFTVQTFVRVITGLLATARELGLWQELRETVGFFFFFL